jgi:uncharacterized protein YegL
MAKSNLELLKAYKKSNKDRKARILTLAGYKTESAYLIALASTTPVVTGAKATPKKAAKKAAPKVVSKIKASRIKQTIHNVFIMDDSGSMRGAKYENGVKGIQELVKSIKQDTLTDNTISIIDLNRGRVIWMENPRDVIYNGHTRLGGTPLFITIGETIESVLKIVGKEHKVLLNIVTDGDDTDGFGRFRNLPKTLKLVQEKHNFTVTFVGTQYDVERSQRNLNIDASNTLVHDNTGAGMTRAFAKTMSSRQTFSSNVAEGRDVKVNFYKEVGTL